MSENAWTMIETVLLLVFCFQIKTELCALKDLPIPTREQLQSITHLLTQVYHTYGLHKEDDLVKRQEVFKQLASITDETFPGICTTTVDALCL
jgi:hypothetical protein